MANPTADDQVSALAHRAIDSADEVDDDDLFSDLDNDWALGGYREQRLEQLKQQVADLTAMKAKGHGQYTEIQDEKAVLKIMTETKHCVVHFFHKEFCRCLIIDKHLQILAPQYIATRFLKIDVANAPFLVAKLKVCVLPCVILTIDGVSHQRLVGFEDLGNKDDFKTKCLEGYLMDAGVIQPRPTQPLGTGSALGHSTHGARSRAENSDDEGSHGRPSRQRHGYIGSANGPLRSSRRFPQNSDDNDDEYA
ncbi:hypothetical protein H4R34_000006 [Dimargaris verticillata]|uniref:Thioredoxin-like protein n=1 Tax=Dimargaris verticillata TaxID=2761393 RepID=A0A9W8B602_9FUNG|nr:hypothetical protein H4R34_000006 [Dimargaris verticillata]